MNSKVNHFMDKSLPAILKNVVERGVAVDDQANTQLVETSTRLTLKKETNNFLENQSTVLKISKHDLINLILDSIAENTQSQYAKVPSRWSVF